jgi:hypothetical protein
MPGYGQGLRVRRSLLLTSTFRRICVKIAGDVRLAFQGWRMGMLELCYTKYWPRDHIEKMARSSLARDEVRSQCYGASTQTLVLHFGSRMMQIVALRKGSPEQ